jgi:hypothetical protein
MAVKNLIAAAAVLVLATGAQASSSVTASLSNFSYAATGSFSWTNAQDDGYYLYAYSSDSATTTTDIFQTGSLFSTAATQTVGTVSSALVSASDTSLKVALSTPATGGAAYGSASWYGHFSLGANSSVSFSWTSSLVGGTAPGESNYGYADVGLGDTLFSAQSSVIGFGPGANISYTINGTVYQYSVGAAGQQIATITTGDIGLTNMSFAARAEGATIDVSAVPETDTLALALSGLAVIGFVARRKRAA